MYIGFNAFYFNTLEKWNEKKAQGILQRLVRDNIERGLMSLWVLNSMAFFSLKICKLSLTETMYGSVNSGHHFGIVLSNPGWISAQAPT